MINEAVQIEHPLTKMSVQSAPDSLRAIFNILVLGPAAIKEKREKFVSKMRGWAEELKPADVRIKASMNKYVLEVTAGKHLELYTADH